MNRPRKIPGHKLTMTWSGEYGEESSSTGECTCGWSESGSSQDVVRDEYRRHLDRVWEQQGEALTAARSLTSAQRRLLLSLLGAPGPVDVRGRQLRTMQALANKGLVLEGCRGTPYKGDWAHQASLTPTGQKVASALKP